MNRKKLVSAIIVGLSFDIIGYIWGYYVIDYYGGESYVAGYYIAINFPVYILLDALSIVSNSFALCLLLIYWFILDLFFQL